MSSKLVISSIDAMRVAVMCQRLAGSRPLPTSEGIMDVMRAIGYLQFDPTRVVERSHLLVLWSRLGQFDPSILEKLLWEERQLFEDWAQTTSIVLTEDYPIFKALKGGFASGDQPWAKRICSWVKKNKAFSHYILSELRRKGPLFSTQFEDRSVEDWRSTGWSAGKNVGIMLYILWAQGKVVIAGRKGIRKLWGLAQHHFPDWVLKEKLSNQEVYSCIAQKSLRALGVARVTHISQHYIRKSCPDIKKVLNQLENQQLVKQVEIKEKRGTLRGPWFIHRDNLPLLHQIMDDAWEPRTTLLSPFDNLIVDRKRTEQLFNFKFRFELYLPKSKRQYGCYVMPILYGDKLIGRVDPVMDRKRKTLKVNAIYVEPNTSVTEETVGKIADCVKELGTFLGASKVVYGKSVQSGWKNNFN